MAAAIEARHNCRQLQRNDKLVASRIVISIFPVLPAFRPASTQRRNMPRSTKKTDANPIALKPKRSRRVNQSPTTQPRITDTDIARLAYELYEARGRLNGSHLDDWFEAERQLLNRPTASVPEFS
jgi:Protein of unknown function (DUF2934)